MSLTFDSFSFGCRVNQAEKDALDRQLVAIGLTQTQAQPHLFIINTCAITAKAEREARQLIYQTRRKLPHTKIIVTGCAATKWMNEKTPIPDADLLIDNASKEFAASLILKRLHGHNRLVAPHTKLPLTFDKYSGSKRVLIKIQDGCQRFCTFCIVPYLRGTPKSRNIAEIVSTVKQYEKDIAEVIFTAINTQAFGYDSGESFIQLIQKSIEETKVPRISFGSIHPWSITNEFLQFYAKVRPWQRVVDFFHIPLQSGSDKILTLMRRGYTRAECIEKLNILHTINPFALIGTDVIVGFLEETDKDFQDTYEFLTQSPISKFHIFRFSPREKTAAFFMKKRLKEPASHVKKRRAKILEELGKKKYNQFLQKHIGEQFAALFLQRRIEGYQQVLLSNQIPAMIKTDKTITGDIKTIYIKQLKQDTLLGTLN